MGNDHNHPVPCSTEKFLPDTALATGIPNHRSGPLGSSSSHLGLTTGPFLDSKILEGKVCRPTVPSDLGSIRLCMAWEKALFLDRNARWDTDTPPAAAQCCQLGSNTQGRMDTACMM
eukprot:2414405-Rhodomonas_salina.2